MAPLPTTVLMAGRLAVAPGAAAPSLEIADPPPGNIACSAAPPMRIIWLILLASTGCGFTSPAPSLDDPRPGTVPGDDEPDAGAPPATRGFCDHTDPSLRLCVDFDGTIIDRSAAGAAVAATGVTPMQRDGEAAASLSAASTMHVHEAATLDILGALSLDMWIQPASKPSSSTTYWMLDNNTQYGAEFTDTGAVRCVLGGRVVDSATALAVDGRFHHIACTYDKAKLKVFVDGDLSRCLDLNMEIPIDGKDGLAIGANLSGSDAVPTFSSPFLGGLDNVRVWSRSDLDACAAAGRTGCRTTCPGS